MGEQFGAVSKYRVTLDGERVVVSIGLDGLKILSASDNRTMRSFDLGHISRWQSRGNNLVLYTKTPVDLEERQLSLSGDDTTIRNVLDTLTCSCMQLAELLQSKQDMPAQETANSLHQLVQGGGKKKSADRKLPSADDVEYWTSPDKAGWLQSQGDHLKSWRRRWFVLKQGYLFRFMNNSVSEGTKPRGVVDLSKVQDVKPGSAVTGRPNTIQLKTAAGGSVCYITDSETEMVEWMSALEGAVAKICKRVAGIEDEPPAASHGGGGPSSRAQGAGGGVGASSELLKQLERNLGQFERAVSLSRDRDREQQPGAASSSRNGGGGAGSLPAMINVVGYEVVGNGAGGGGANGGGVAGLHHGGDSYGGGGGPGGYGGSGSAGLGYGSGIAGVAGVVGGGGVDPYSISNDPYLRGASSYAASSGSKQQQPLSYGNYASGGYAQPQQAQPSPQQQQQDLLALPPMISLIDSVPQQQPSYPYFQQQQQPSAPAAQAAAPALPPSTWQMHYTAEGKPYFYNTATGHTTWDAPAGM